MFDSHTVSRDSLNNPRCFYVCVAQGRLSGKKDLSFLCWETVHYASTGECNILLVMKCRGGVSVFVLKELD